MPGPIQAPVNWSGGKGQVGDIVVPTSNGPTQIQWVCGTDVASFEIKGLDAAEFNPSQSNGQVTSFLTTDACDQSKTYHYTVRAVKAGTGEQSTHDPKIENEV